MNWCPFEFIGKTFGEERCVPEYGDPPDFRSGVLVDGGICYMQFLKKLFIPCYARTENVKKAVCSPKGLNDPSQRCRQKKKKHKSSKRRHNCVPEKSETPKPSCPQTSSSSSPKCFPKVQDKIPESTPESQLQSMPQTPQTPQTQQHQKREKILRREEIPVCPDCRRPATVIICDSCKQCCRIECDI